MASYKEIISREFSSREKQVEKEKSVFISGAFKRIEFLMQYVKGEIAWLPPRDFVFPKTTKEPYDPDAVKQRCFSTLEEIDKIIEKQTQTK